MKTREEIKSITPRLLLEVIVDSIDKITCYSQDMSYEEFVSDTRTFDVVVRNLAERLPIYCPRSFKSGIPIQNGTGL